MPSDAAPKRREWNHLPETPIAVSPLWQWPPKPLAAARWYLDSWFFLTINMMIVAISFASFVLASPTLETAAAPGLWIAVIWLRNAAIVSLVAGVLHLWFHKYAMQGEQLKYDPRPFPRAGRMCSFGNQLHDNIFWTIASGVTIWSAFEALLWWSMANGYVAVITFETNPIWFVAIFFLIPVWESFYFYWMHRFLHTNIMYRFHALHHRNNDIGPWSGMSMHPVEHLFYFGSVLIHFAIASHPVHIIFHLAFYGLLAITSHTGFEGLLFRNKKRITTFLVDRGHPGFTIRDGYKSVSHRGYKNMILDFDDCRIPDAQVLGEVDGGFAVMNEWLYATRITIATMSVGRAHRLFDYALGYAVEREQFGQKIGKFQGISFQIADMITEIDAADRLDKGLPANREIASAKLYASEMLGRVTDAAIQVHGGMGLMDDYPLERFWRDARVERIWDGTSEIQRHIISRELLHALGALGA